MYSLVSMTKTLSIGWDSKWWLWDSRL